MRHLAGQMENAQAENAFAALILIGCRNIKKFNGQ